MVFKEKIRFITPLSAIAQRIYSTEFLGNKIKIYWLRICKSLFNFYLVIKEEKQIRNGTQIFQVKIAAKFKIFYFCKNKIGGATPHIVMKNVWKFGHNQFSGLRSGLESVMLTMTLIKDERVIPIVYVAVLQVGDTNIPPCFYF